jgi:hypothetical protein
VKFFFVEKSFPSTMVYAGPKAPDISQFLWDVLIKLSKSFSSLGQSKWILTQSSIRMNNWVGVILRYVVQLVRF